MISLSTGSLNTYGTHRVFELAAKAGFDGVEIMVDRRWDTRDAAYLRRLSSDYGLPIVALHNPFPPDVDGWPRDQLGRLRHTVAVAQEAGIAVVVTHLPMRLYTVALAQSGPRARRLVAPMPWLWKEPYYHLLNDGGLRAMEESAGLSICVENMPARRFFGVTVDLYWFNSADELLQFPHLTLDTTHLGTWGLDPLETWARLKGRVAHVHLSNFADDMEHRPPPKGELPLAKLLQQMARDGYKGAISVEGEPYSLHAEDEGRCLAELRQALQFCRDSFVAE